MTSSSLDIVELSFKKYLFIYLTMLGHSCGTRNLWSLLWRASSSAVARRIFSWGMRTLSRGLWDLVPWPGIWSGAPLLGVWTLSHWATAEVPEVVCYWIIICPVLTSTNIRWNEPRRFNSVVKVKYYPELVLLWEAISLVTYRQDPPTSSSIGGIHDTFW